MDPQNQRESFGSRLGFILVSAGCAIGIGNVWRFPTVTGQYGGGIFVLFYLLFLVLMGLPVLTMELAVGRAGRGAARSAYKALEPSGSKWHIHGWFCMAGCVLLMMYYTTVSGWMVDYFFRFLTGSFDGLTSEQAAGVFGEMLSNPVEMVFWMVVITLAGFVVCGRGLQGGLEKVGKWMMSALLVLILVLVVHSFTLSGAGEGLAFYLLPDWSRATGQGLGNVITAAMNQSFFTLSLGIGAIEIFGSYMDRGFTLPGEAARICVLDTFVAVCAGLIIFPACFSFGISPDAGPSLIFITLPNVFTNMAGGRLWGALFFLFMTFASFSTVIAVLKISSPVRGRISAGTAAGLAWWARRRWSCWACPARWATTCGAASSPWARAAPCWILRTSLSATFCCRAAALFICCSVSPNGAGALTNTPPSATPAAAPKCRSGSSPTLNTFCRS